MSSPPPLPPSAHSPTGGSFPVPSKRPSLSNLPGASSHKRRKTSFASTSSHPLRQTSFPPPGAASPTFSPSRQSSFSPSVSSFGGRGGRSKKRKQHARASSQAIDTTSKLGADEAKSNKDGEAKGDQEDDEDDEDLGDAENTMLENTGLADIGSKEENENLAMLLDAFTPEQEERYEAYRRVRLKKEVVRRIVNQTLSQSVPQSIVTTINGYTKVFIGDIVERARDVQAEWIAAKQYGKTETNGEPAANGVNDLGQKQDSPLEIKESERGPLTPDHLREALRRYKKDQEGGNAGLQGLSIQGLETAASKNRGKRLFR